MDLAALVDRYCAVWAEAEPALRASALDQVWAQGATYTDPSVETLDRTALLAHIGEIQARWPGARLVRTSEVDHHHGVARFSWRAVQADGPDILDGVDIVFLTRDGAQIEQIVGFFGSLTTI